MYRFRILFLTLLVSTQLQATAQTNLMLPSSPSEKIVIDISGVLLEQDMLSAVNKLMPEDLQFDVPSIFHHPLMGELMKLFAEHHPLGIPSSFYPADCPLPYEIYALFTGETNSAVVHDKFNTMIKNSTHTNEEMEALTAFVNALFHQENFASCMTLISSSTYVLDRSYAQVEKNNVYFYSNMPREWVLQHREIIPELKDISAKQIITASDIGQLKPYPAAYHALAKHLDVPLAEITLIDDQEKDLAIAQHLGMNVVHFDIVATELDQFNSRSNRDPK